MLNLQTPTDPRWLDLALASIDAVLLDHAHCEKKAASMALSLIFKYPDHTPLVLPLSHLAREELTHFELVVDHLRQRGLEFERQKPSPYAGRLMAIVRPDEPGRLLDTLLCCALIEARSCERMKLLAESLPDARLAELYRGLLTSEARHHTLFVELARTVGSPEVVRDRLLAIAAHEATLLAEPSETPRMHS